MSTPIAFAWLGPRRQGGRLTAVSIPAISEIGAYRNLTLDILSGSFSSGSAASIQFGFSSGILDYSGPQTGVGQVPFAGIMGPDSSGQAATLSTAGSVETLRIPVSFSFSGANGLAQSLDGTIVAFRPVPEPSPALLGLAGVGASFVVCRFRLRKHNRTRN